MVAKKCAPKIFRPSAHTCARTVLEKNRCRWCWYGCIFRLGMSERSVGLSLGSGATRLRLADSGYFFRSSAGDALVHGIGVSAPGFLRTNTPSRCSHSLALTIAPSARCWCTRERWCADGSGQRVFRGTRVQLCNIHHRNFPFSRINALLRYAPERNFGRGPSRPECERPPSRAENLFLLFRRSVFPSLAPRCTANNTATH